MMLKREMEFLDDSPKIVAIVRYLEEKNRVSHWLLLLLAFMVLISPASTFLDV